RARVVELRHGRIAASLRGRALLGAPHLAELRVAEAGEAADAGRARAVAHDRAGEPAAGRREAVRDAVEGEQLEGGRVRPGADVRDARQRLVRGAAVRHEDVSARVVESQRHRTSARAGALSVMYGAPSGESPARPGPPLPTRRDPRWRRARLPAARCGGPR